MSTISSNVGLSVQVRIPPALPPSVQIPAEPLATSGAGEVIAATSASNVGPSVSTSIATGGVPAGAAGASTGAEPSGNGEQSTDASGDQPPATDAPNEQPNAAGAENTETAPGTSTEDADAPQGLRPESERFSEAELEELARLEARDQEVRQHEQAHVSTGGQFVVGGPQFDFQIGPDGRRYAVGGDVRIDVSEVPNDPRATIRKMQQIRRAALAPQQPSSQDRRVAASATQVEAEARQDLREQQREEAADDQQRSSVIADLERSPAEIANEILAPFEANVPQSDNVELSASPGVQRRRTDAVTAAFGVSGTTTGSQLDTTI